MNQLRDVGYVSLTKEALKTYNNWLFSSDDIQECPFPKDFLDAIRIVINHDFDSFELLHFNEEGTFQLYSEAYVLVLHTSNEDTILFAAANDSSSTSTSTSTATSNSVNPPVVDSIYLKEGHIYHIPYEDYDLICSSNVEGLVVLL